MPHFVARELSVTLQEIGKLVTLLKGLKVDIDETADRKHGDGLIENVEDVDALVADGD